jgi:hypothetical protein
MAYEVDFLPVGESYGDAIVIRYGDENDGYYRGAKRSRNTGQRTLALTWSH